MEVTLTTVVLVLVAHVLVLFAVFRYVKGTMTVKKRYKTPETGSAFVVTGGSSGIGLAAVAHLANAGHIVRLF